jgi:hypothetical protein
MKITLTQYLKGFTVLRGGLAAIPFILPLIHLVDGYFSEDDRLYPPLGPIQPLAIAGTITLLLVTILVAYEVCGSIARIRGSVSLMLTLAALVCFVSLFPLYSKYVRVIPNRVLGTEVHVSIGSTRTEFAQKYFSDKSDEEKLHIRGTEEEQIRKLWTDDSVWKGRAALCLAYTLMACFFLSVVCVSAYRHALQEATSVKTVEA